MEGVTAAVEEEQKDELEADGEDEEGAPLRTGLHWRRNKLHHIDSWRSGRRRLPRAQAPRSALEEGVPEPNRLHKKLCEQSPPGRSVCTSCSAATGA